MQSNIYPYRKLLPAIFLIGISILFWAASPMIFLAPGLENPEPISPYLNGFFPSSTPSGGAGGGDISYTIQNAFPNLTFKDPVDMAELPGGEHFLVVGLQGHIWKIANTSLVGTKELLLDISANTVVNTDGGMLGIVLHPEYGQAGSPNAEYVYVFYRYTPVQGTDFTGAGTNAYMRLSRFNLPVGANSINPSSEYVLIQVFDRHDWHNGGDMFFGPEGFLYLVVGDEGAANDSYGVTQQIDKWLFGGVLRIDVDQKGGSISHPIRRQPWNAGTPPIGWPSSFTQGYYIPNDNPWLDPSGGILEEFYAIGTRSPHRMTYDPPTGEIWIGDIGQGAREEISVVRKADNLQWPYREGNVNGPKSTPSPLIGNDRPPIYAYGRSVGRSVTGGFVYRGTRYPELTDKYFFGDHETQNVWTLNRVGENLASADYLLTVPVNGAGSKDGISSFYVDSDEFIYILDLFGTNQDGGVIHKLVRTGATADPPERLSSLNVFTNLQTLQTAPGIIPYDVNAPLWSDRAKKRRWIALPNDGSHNAATEQITFDKEGNWIFPPGTVMIKHFDLPVSESNPDDLVKLETRFVVFTDIGDAYAVTYKWNREGTDAFLVGIDEQPSEDYIIKRLDGSTYTQTWEFPSRLQCMECHNAVAGYALGVKTRQLNKNITYPSTGILSNQLETWNHLKMFDQNIGDPSELPALANLAAPNTSAEMRVRSYIDANCSYCHRPNGVEGAFDARSLNALYDQNLIQVEGISHATPAGSKIVMPGEALHSEIHIRDGSTTTNQMPPIGRNFVDEEYMTLLTSWINNLDANGPETIVDGWYTLQALHSQLYLAVEEGATTADARAVQTTIQEEDHGKWYIQQMGNDKYRIIAGHSNMALAVQDLRTNRGALVVQEPWTGEQHQLWYFEDTNNGYYRIINAYHSLELNVHGGHQTDGSYTITWTPGVYDNQQWKLEPTEGTSACVNTEEVPITDLDWVSATTGYGTIRENTNLAGNPLTINGTTYSHGIGTHAQSEIIYDLAGEYQTFTAAIGIDDSAPISRGSVQFEVIGDNNSLYLSPVLTGFDDAVAISVNVSNIQQLRLIAHEVPEQSPANDPDNYDHADWAVATLHRCTTSLPVDCANLVESPLTELSWDVATSGWGTTQENTNLAGNLLTINGNTYTHGIGTHAQSEIIYTLAGQYQMFTADIGLDDSAPLSRGSVQFEVFGDNTSLYISSVMTGADDPVSIFVDITDVQELRLVVHEVPEQSPASDPDNYDHADWAAAALHRCEESGPLDCPDLEAGPLTDIAWISASSGWGTTQVNTNLAGNALTINGTTYTHGIGTHAQSEIIYDLGGQYKMFKSDIGVDDSAPAGRGSVQFEVIGDNTSLYLSSVMTGSDEAIAIEVEVTNVQELKLVVHEVPEQSPASDPDNYDHADWAGATLERCIPCTDVNTQLTSLSWNAATIGWGSIQENTNLAGNPLTINGTTYPHGIGTHAQSEISYSIAGQYHTFTSAIGLDDSAPAGRGSVQFEVLGDNTSLYLGPVMTGSDDPITITVDITDVQDLTLIAHEVPEQSPASDPDNYDHADWAAATLIGCEGATALSQLGIAHSNVSDPLFNRFKWIDVASTSYSHMVQIDWEVEKDEKVSAYILERSLDGSQFKVITDQPGVGIGTQNEYSSIDENPTIGTAFYRVQVQHEGGSVEYSQILTVVFENPGASVLVYPNPIGTNQVLTADIKASHLEELSIRIMDAQGRVLQNRRVSLQAVQTFEQFDTKNLIPGVYFLQVEGSTWSQTKQFIVN